MATVTNTIKLPDGTAPTYAAVEIELIAAASGHAAGWVNATDVTVLSVARPAVTAGAWSAALTPNADIDPADTVYRVNEYVDRTRYVHYIDVGSGGGTVHDLLVDPPASLATAALTSHLIDPIGAHEASAIAFTPSGTIAATTTQAAIAEVATDAAAALTAHTGDTVDAHLSTAIGYGSTTVSDALTKLPFQRSVAVMPPTNSPIVTTFAAGHGYTMLSTTLTSLTDDTTSYALGSQSLKAVLKSDASAGSCQKLSQTIDTTAKSVRIWVNIEDTTHLTSLLVYFSNNAFSAYYLWEVMAGGGEAQNWFKSGEWQAITLSFADAQITGSPTRGAVTAVRLRAACANGFTTNVRWGGISLVPEQAEFPGGVVSLCFDDIYATNWTTARPIMDAYGYGGTMYAIPSRATASFVTTDQMHQMEAASGWEVAGHGLTDLTSLSASAAEADVLATKTWLLENGFRGAGHYAYPGGGYSPTIEAILRRYYTSARTIVSVMRHETLPPANPHRLRSPSVSPLTSSATVTGYIDNCIANDSWLILTFHDLVVSSPNSVQWEISKFQAVMDYLSANSVAVHPVGDVLSRVLT